MKKRVNRLMSMIKDNPDYSTSSLVEEYKESYDATVKDSTLSRDVRRARSKLEDMPDSDSASMIRDSLIRVINHCVSVEMMWALYVIQNEWVVVSEDRDANNVHEKFSVKNLDHPNNAPDFDGVCWDFVIGSLDEIGLANVANVAREDAEPFLITTFMGDLVLDLVEKSDFEWINDFEQVFLEFEEQET